MIKRIAGSLKKIIQKITCPSCGAQTSSKNKFCPECGHSLEKNSDE